MCRLKNYKCIFVFLCLLLMVTGCSRNTTEVDMKKEAPNSTVEQTQYPKIIHHLEGSTTIDKKPERIATPYISFVDYLAVLGVFPIAGQGIGTIQRNFPYLNELIKDHTIIDLGQEVDIEKVLAVKPELIIAADDMSDKYEQLSKIAPTVILPQAGDWRETLMQIGEIVGAEEKVREVLVDFDEKTARYKQELSKYSNETVLFTMYQGKEKFVTWDIERFEPFYNGLGLKPVPEAEKGGTISLEGLGKLNPDHIFVVNNWQTPIAGGVEKDLEHSAVWSSLNAVKNKQVYFLDDPSLPGPLALAKIKGIEDIYNALK